MNRAAYPDSSTETLSYDADSNVLTRLTRLGDTITLTYDTLNRLSTKAAPSEATVTYAYDLGGRLIGASDTSAAVTAAASPAGTLATAGMTYDEVNRPLSFTLGPAPTQAAPTASQSAFAFAYDLTNRRIDRQGRPGPGQRQDCLFPPGLLARAERQFCPSACSLIKSWRTA